jgi:hypothetical protein
MIQVERQWLFMARLMLKDYSYRKKGSGQRTTERPLQLMEIIKGIIGFLIFVIISYLDLL